MSRRRNRRRYQDDSWHQTELQWLEDGIHILLHEIRCLVWNLLVLIGLILKGIWTVVLFVVRKLR